MVCAPLHQAQQIVVEPCRRADADGSLDIFPRGVIALQVEVQTSQTEKQRGVTGPCLSRQLQARGSVLQIARLQQYTRFVDQSRCFALQYVVIILLLYQLGKSRQSHSALRRPAQPAPRPCELIEDPCVISSAQLRPSFQLHPRLSKSTQTIQRGAEQEVSFISVWLQLDGLPQQRHRGRVIARPRQQVAQAG